MHKKTQINQYFAFIIYTFFIINILTMIQLNTARLARQNKWLEWEKYLTGAFIRFPQTQLSLHTLFFVHSNITFNHVMHGMGLPQEGISYPEGINSQSKVLDFLINDKKAKAVQITLRNGEKKFLRNRACDRQIQIVKNVIADTNSIYSYMQRYLNNPDEDPYVSGKINYFLNQFYMRLTAQTYCKLKGIKPTQILNQQLKHEILNYIGEEYENHSPAAIRKVSNERDIILAKIAQTKKQIQKIQQEGDRKIKIYKIGAVLITAAHIISFGYMIFFVDWLGWDIIQPLTYSVGVAYTLLGIRFYRKYRTDRTGSSIRQTLLRIIMKPSKIIQLKDLKFRLQMQQKQLTRIQTRDRLLKNRINFRSSLADAYSQRIRQFV